MPQTATLQSSSSKKTKVNPVKMIGGTFEEILETVTGGGTGFTNEKPAQEQEPEKPEKFSSGSLFFTARWNQEISMGATQAATEKNRQEALKARRAEVNKKIGISNLDYTGTVNEDFTLRADVQADLDRANSELSEKELKAKKESMIAKGTGKGSRVFGADMNRNFEDQNMAGPG